MDTSFALDIFQSGQLLWLPLALFLAFIVLYIPSLMVAEAKPMAVGQAIFCYFMKTVGILLMAASIVPLAYNLMSNTVPDITTLYSLVLFLVVGLGIVVHFSRVAYELDEASVVVVRSVFCHCFEAIGALLAIFSGLSLMMMFLVNHVLLDWQMPATLFLLGLLTMLLFSMHLSHKQRTHGTRMAKGKKK